MVPGAESVAVACSFSTVFLLSLSYSSGKRVHVGANSGAPLLQFWHHEVADPRAKPRQKFKSQTKNLKGFQRDWWIPGPSIFYCFLNEFQHFAEIGHQGYHEGFLMPISENSGLALGGPRRMSCTRTGLRGCIWNVWDQRSSKTPSFGRGVARHGTCITLEVEIWLRILTKFSHFLLKT